MIADTSFLIDFLKRDEKAIEKAKKLEDKNRAYSISSPTVYEVRVGVSRSDAEEKEEMLDIISSQIIHNLDKKSGLNSAKIQQNLLKEGQRISHLDALIAEIAKENTNKVPTNNTEEFGRVENLEVEDYK